MRKITLRSLLASALLLTAGNTWALDKEGDVYQIGTAQDLADFAALVNDASKENVAANAVVTADIDLSGVISEETPWVPIGNWVNSLAYKGKFNGQGHTISGLTYTTNRDYHGLFGVVSSGAVIENFTISGEITNAAYNSVGAVGFARDTEVIIRNINSKLNITSTIAGKRCGGILGTSYNGKVTIDKCRYDGNMTITDNGNSGNYGGIVGYVNNATGAILNVTSCVFSGQVTGTVTGGCTIGGVLGYVGTNPVITVANCLVTGSVDVVNEAQGGLYCGSIKSNFSADNNYYVGDTNLYGTSSSGWKAFPATLSSTEQLKSGELTYLLNGDQSKIAYYQTIGTDVMPTLDATHGQVYANGVYACDGTPKTIAYSNTNTGATTEKHSYESSYCTECGDLQSVDGVYQIDNAEQLKWFATHVNTADQKSSAVLTTDIDMAGVTIPVIGNSSTNAYKGVFDGQGHKITNYSLEITEDLVKSYGYGLFGNTSGATIKNFYIGGSITCKMTSPGDLGIATIGWPDGNTLIQNVHSAIDLDVTSSTHVGGLVGSLRTATVESCEYSGTLNGNDIKNSAAGIAGYSNNGKIYNSIFSGVVKGTGTGYFAGILGYVNSAVVEVKNCLSYGTVDNSVSQWAATGIARLRNINLDVYANNYYMGAKGVGGGEKVDDATVVAGTISVTAEQLASGEVAYKLGEKFYQTIGTDNAPTLSSESAKVQYVGAAGYATMVAAADTKLVGDAKAYIGALNPESGMIKLTEVADVPAGAAVILKGTYYNSAATTATADVAGNELKAATEDITADGTQYVLAKVDGVVGFYKATGTIPAGKAYFKSAADVKGFFFGEDENATGISQLNAQSSQLIYNLAGQRVSKMQKGINIVNGKKVLF